ncbi:VOC family protein [Flavobacterium wongokense]|uniref:VOC family protein n=1 Tax=Flavobacterium wongokense TaxID=2910674 RepID=UPI001F488C3C|nr:VOC family protein [Flavobacterium sp. WG47]MCF6131931.1 VOC family protein [Flavobacterium sp. WG47]
MENRNPVVHFEMPAEDRNRMAVFYSKAFGWKTQMLGEDMGNYVVVTTTDTDDDGMIKNPGAINGGFYPKNDEVPDQYPSLVIGVEDIREAMDNIIEAGGKLLGEPMEIPGHGLYVSFYDTEGNKVSIIQPTTKMQAGGK